MTNNNLLITKDGSHTLYNDFANEHYHSSFGAIQESKHIFINAGLNTVVEKNIKQIKLLEVGTGTGLNILLAYLWSIKNSIAVEYNGFEPFPIPINKITELNYPKQLLIDEKLFWSIHNNFDREIFLNNNFSAIINTSKIENSKLRNDYYDIVFFDAFSPQAQPELWTTKIFEIIFNALKQGGVLTTYSCKGTVKRALKSVGFRIEKLAGPPGKREFLRAWKD